MQHLANTGLKIFSGAVLAAALFAARPALAAPLLANYYLSNLPTDESSIAQLARYDVLVLSPEEALIRGSVIAAIKERNPAIILLAYVPTKSYTDAWERYPASLIYKDLRVQGEWWLRDSRGSITSDWEGHRNINLDPAWSDYLLGYIQEHVLSVGVWDGIFWDVVYHDIAWFNGGDIDLDRDGARDDSGAADAEWLRRIVYLLEQSRVRLPVKYMVINGSSHAALQASVNGRMYENFPTPWEAHGSWAGLMNGLIKNQSRNRSPQLYIFNANTGNTGHRADYRAMRFGLASSLLADNVYFSFDYGTENHAQLWWYDEYNAELGSATAAPVSAGGAQPFTGDVWRRDFAHGLVLVNATATASTIALGGDYEKLNGAQDPAVNDGTLVEFVTVPARDGIILLKIFQTVPGIAFRNGTFARFFTPAGGRARSGFFLFEEGVAGGARVWQGSLNGQPQTKLVATKGKLEAFAAGGSRQWGIAPFGERFTGELRLAAGPAGVGGARLVVAAASGGELKTYGFDGELVTGGVYPLGKTYRDGFSMAIKSGGGAGEVVVGVTGRARSAEVFVYNADLTKVTRRFFPYGKIYRGGVNVAAGDLDGDGSDEIITVSRSERLPLVRVFDERGRQRSEFPIRGFFGPQIMEVAVADVNFDGQKEIVVMSSN